MSVTDMLMALGNTDGTIRRQAEQALASVAETNLAEYLTTLIGELRDGSKPVFARRMAVSLIRNAIAPSLREVAARQVVAQRWLSLPPDVRQAVKSEMVAALGTENTDMNVRNAIANAIGCMSRVELPRNGWPELIGILLGATQSAAPEHQDAALTTIGYICEEGRDSEEVEEALEPHTTDLLGAMLQCLGSANEQVQLSAITALSNAMEYISSNMNQDAQRDYLVNAVCTTASTASNVKTRETAMQCLVKIAELYYTFLPAYISRLHEITTNAIRNDDEAVGLQAMQFWISICDREADCVADGNESGNLHYAQEGLDFLSSLCLELLQRQEEGQTEYDWNLSLAASKLLLTLASAVGGAIHGKVMNFVYQNINGADWRQREAALMVFGCIIGVEDENARLAIRDTVMQATPGLLQYMNDSHEMVADTAAWVTCVVCEHFVECFLDTREGLQNLLNVVGPLITGSSEIMSIRGVNIITSLALAFEDADPTPSNELSPFIPDIIPVVMRVVDSRESSSTQRAEAQECINALIDASADDIIAVYLPQLFPQIEQRMMAQLAPYANGGTLSSESEEMLSLYAGAISAIASKMGPKFMPAVPQCVEMLFRLMDLSDAGIIPPAWVAIGKLTYVAKEQFSQYVPRVMPRLTNGLSTFNEPDAMYIFVGAVGDLCINCPQAVAPFIGDLMNVLYSNLHNPDVDRDLKCTFLACMGDIVLNVMNAETVQPYLDTIMSLAGQIFTLTTQIDVRGDPDSADYVITMWESLSTLFASIINIFRGANLAPLLGHVGGILSCVVHIISNCNSPDTEETLVEAATVLADLALTIVESRDPQLIVQGQQALLGPSVTGVLQSVRVKDKDAKKTMAWVQKSLGKLRGA